jgi:hypothetical protein
MERYCGFLAASGKSRRSPYMSLTYRICDIAQLNQIKIIYDLEGELDLQGESGMMGKSFGECKHPIINMISVTYI